MMAIHMSQLLSRVEGMVGDYRVHIDLWRTIAKRTDNLKQLTVSDQYHDLLIILPNVIEVSPCDLYPYNRWKYTYWRPRGMLDDGDIVNV